MPTAPEAARARGRSGSGRGRELQRQLSVALRSTRRRCCGAVGMTRGRGFTSAATVRRRLASLDGTRRTQHPLWRTDGEAMSKLRDLAPDGLDLRLAEVGAALVQPLVARHELRPIAGEVSHEVLARPGPEVQHVRPDRGGAGVAGRLDHV